ncbi:MAG TPA: hypothetical protein VMU87_00275 [Stellaceae bacterium]|nr:hypothetical protein [Stellaceae bacterium]
MTMPRRLLPLLLCAGLLALAAGCSNAPPRPNFPELSFTAEPPIRLDVVRIDVRNDYQPPFRAPNVDHLFPVPPMRAADDWARDRLKATQPIGTGGLELLGVFTLKNASVTETDLPQQTGITSMFTTQPGKRYDLTLQATVQITDAQGIPLRSASVTVKRSQTQPDGITPNDRDRAWYAMTKTAMAAFDRQMEAEIRNNFGIYYDQ